MSIPVAKGTPVSRAGRLIVQILPGHRLLREKRQFRPGAGGNNRRSQPSNPLHSSDRECWDQLRGTARHYSRRLQQLVLGRLSLIWAAFFWSPRDLFAPPHPTLLRRTQVGESGTSTPRVRPPLLSLAAFPPR